jgi:hypothetical protein
MLSLRQRDRVPHVLLHRGARRREALPHVLRKAVQGDRTPYDVFEAYYGEEAARKLGIRKADPTKIGLLMSGRRSKK